MFDKLINPSLDWNRPQFFLRFQTCKEHETIGASTQQAHAHLEQKNNGIDRPLAALMPSSSFIQSSDVLPLLKRSKILLILRIQLGAFCTFYQNLNCAILQKHKKTTENLRCPICVEQNVSVEHISRANYARKEASSLKISTNSRMCWQVVRILDKN